MAETCEITLKKLPSRKMRRQVKKFMKNEDVEFVDDSGKLYRVDLKRNTLIITPFVSNSVQNDDGGCMLVEH